MFVEGTVEPHRRRRATWHKKDAYKLYYGSITTRVLSTTFIASPLYIIWKYTKQTVPNSSLVGLSSSRLRLAENTSQGFSLPLSKQVYNIRQYDTNMQAPTLYKKTFNTGAHVRSHSRKILPALLIFNVLLSSFSMHSYVSPSSSHSVDTETCAYL